jgi:low affinity Fe/Cu permease
MAEQAPEAAGSSAALGAMPSTSSASYATHSPLLGRFDRFASRVTRWAGSPAAFCVAFVTVLIWGAVGPLFHFSENWQLVINTGTTIVTFLMVFLIQQSQNKDSVAMHLKLNELLASSRNASTSRSRQAISIDWNFSPRQPRAISTRHSSSIRRARPSTTSRFQAGAGTSASGIIACGLERFPKWRIRGRRRSADSSRATSSPLKSRGSARIITHPRAMSHTNIATSSRSASICPRARRN